ncbi:transporter substrate-binding domain-containing protein [Lacimicrobium sp. SS2-24]|uniref:substrate-binding periplasmic protein n=1 Tax=Lacimicrobium sp. SS2-24 TaxID=2005569 RepID=UPI000B4AC89A|nr:transporter substrate-binding domain-containing protein [Lacimicrobium sp. SS2-24]
MNWVYAVLLLTFCVTVKAAELTVAFGQSRPPYVDEVLADGISVRLFDAVAQKLEWQYQAIFVSNLRMDKLLEQGQVDISVEVQPNNPSLFYSQPFIAYYNYAIHRHSADLALNDINDLQHFSLCAWQSANEHIGISTWTENKADYWEYPEQKWQVADWLNGRCEVVLIDETLLSWHLQQFKTRPEHSDKKIQLDRLGKALLPIEQNPLWFYVGFSEASLRDAFDRELTRLKKSGRYDDIRNHFTQTKASAHP